VSKGTVARPALHVVGAAILDVLRQEACCLVAQRGPAMSQPGRWEFPGGKVEARETPSAALVRELREELGIEIEVGPWLGRGEAIVDGREIVLDVFAATRRAGEPLAREHAQLRWIGANEIDALDWPDADRPILPFLRRALTRGLAGQTLARALPIVSVDWSSRAQGRAVCTATPDASGWRVECVVAPAGGWALEAVLARAEAIAAPFGGACLVAIDAVLGVPSRFGASLGAADFPALLERFASQGELERASRGSPSGGGADVEAVAWSKERPFFRVGAGPGGLGRLVADAGGRATLYRQIERATGGNPVFALSGIPGTVGSGSLALWRELLALRRAGGPRLRLWPFEVELDAVADAGCPVLAESYPRACYAVALAGSLPTAARSLGKSKPAVRRAALEALAASDWIRRRTRGQSLGSEALAAASQGEDDFDALLQAVALARLVDEGRTLATQLVDPRFEGGIVGTGGLEPFVPRRRARRPD
jgi:8-oxo-dGTP diphosphatase